MPHVVTRVVVDMLIQFKLLIFFYTTSIYIEKKKKKDPLRNVTCNKIRQPAKGFLEATKEGQRIERGKWLS